MLNEEKVTRQYDLWSRVYDHTFGRLLDTRHQRAVEELRLRQGDRVLDLGIGTGMTLEHYPIDVNVVGLDFSGGMLAQARQKINRRGMTHAHLVQGDALCTPFADDSFDHILITHVISVVSDPAQLMREAARVLKPGGRAVVLNHFRSTSRLIGAVEKIVNPLCVRLGWRSDLSLTDAMNGAPLAIQYQFKLTAVDVWQIVVLGDPNAPDADNAPAAAAGTTADAPAGATPVGV